MPKKKVNKAVDYLTFLNSEEGKEELEDVCKRISASMEKDNDACNDYINSTAFAVIIRKLKAYMKKTKEILSPAEYEGKNIIRGVSIDRFYYIFKTIFTVHASDVYTADFDFPNENINYEGIIFSQVYGQGTHCEMALEEDSRFKKE